MKTHLLVLCALCCAVILHAQSPTPIPMATPAAGRLATATVNIPLATFQTGLTAVPSTPQSLAQLIASVIALPTGADAAHFRSMVILVPTNTAGQPIGTVRVTLTYATFP